MTRPQTRREKIVAMAIQSESPEEAAVAREKLRGDLTILPRAQQALMEATTLTEMKDVHDFAVTLRAGAKARGMGIESENMAADLIIRAERMMGVELIRMAETGERYSQGQGQSVNPEVSGRPMLRDFGLTSHEIEPWQRLAAIPDDQWETLLDQERNALGPNGQPLRLSRINLVRMWFGTQPKAPSLHVTPTAEDGGFDMFRQGAYALLLWRVGEDGVGGPTGSMLITLPDDELRQLAALIKALAAAYNEEKSHRG